MTESNFRETWKEYLENVNNGDTEERVTVNIYRFEYGRR